PTYTMQVQWGSINPKFYSAWDYDNRQPANGVKDEALPIVTRFALEQNFPNPFNPTTEIRFAIPEKSDVQLSIYNLLGQSVRKVTYNDLNVGNYSFVWDSRDMHGNAVASGIYFYELRAGNKYHAMKKMVLVK
ncbi:MAG: FlgD immunoglobulin-like domain containing protein, partial [Candidatus Neomarinimicrobiota bacterium]